MVSGSGIGSSSRLSAIVKSDMVVLLVDGDEGAEDSRLLSEGISRVGEGRPGG